MTNKFAKLFLEKLTKGFRPLLHQFEDKNPVQEISNILFLFNIFFVAFVHRTRTEESLKDCLTALPSSTFIVSEPIGVIDELLVLCNCAS
jgi:hypothetical protein